MIQNKIIPFLAIGFVFIMFSVTAHAATLKVVVNDVTPQPVEPGSDLTLRVTYSNFNTDFIRNVNAQVDLRYPFSLKTATEVYDGGFDLCAYCSRTNTYFIHVDDTATSGTYPVFIRIPGNDADSLKTFNVTVRGIPNIVLSTNIVMNATPSQAFTLPIVLNNIGSGTAHEIRIMPSSSDFIALGSSTVIVQSLDAKNTSIALFTIVPDNNLKAGSYNLPFQISYKDESGTSHNVTQNIGLRIINNALLNIESIKVVGTGGQVIAGQPTSIIVRFENIGYGNANAIQSEITCDGQSSKSFLGQLKKDEDAPAVFTVSIPQAGKQDCTVKSVYTDDTGSKTITSSFDVTVKAPDFPVGSVVFVIIILIIIGYYFKKRHQKTK